MTVSSIVTIELTVEADATSWQGAWPPLPAAAYGMHVEFDASRYPLERHLCYMRRREPAVDPALRKFVDMEFAPEPPGIPVGPWPGWRGIPDMPVVELVAGTRSYKASPNFWGDEFDTRCCRYFVTAEMADVAVVRLQWSDRRLRPIRLHIYPSAKKPAGSQPVHLARTLRDRHPRLLFTDDFRQHLRDDPARAGLRQHLEQWQEQAHLPFEVTTESKTLDGPERLHDMDRLILAAFMAWLSEEAPRINRAVVELRRFLAVVADPGYEPMNIDTQAGECLFTLCLAFDWLFPSLSPTERSEFQDALFRAADRVWRHLGFDRQDYAQAHFLGCSHGLLAFSFLFWNEHPQAQAWAAYLHAAFRQVVRMLPDDGFFPHGINLWIYEHTFLIRYLELFRHCAGIDFWSVTTYWQNASCFRRWSLSPDRLHGITFGDPQYRVSGDAWIHYAIAARTGSAAAQDLAGLLSDLATEGVDFRSVPPRRRVWEYIFFNGEIPQNPVVPEAAFCEDGGQLFYRRQGAARELLFTCRAGAPLGRQRYAAGEWSGYGHSDPGNGSFLLMVNRDFVVCGPGPVYRRDTLLHNTMTFNGRGQIGDRLPWAPEFIPQQHMAQVTRVDHAANLCRIEMDLTRAYLPHLRVLQCRRCFYLLQGDVLVIHDRVRVQEECEMQWNVHTRAGVRTVSETPHPQLRLETAETAWQLLCLAPAPVSIRTGLSEFVPAYPNSGEADRFIQFYGMGQQKDYIIVIAPVGAELQWPRTGERHDRIAHFSLTIAGATVVLW